MVALGLLCCTQAFSSCGKLGLFSWCVGFSLGWLLEAYGFSSCSMWAPGCGLSSGGEWAQLRPGMWDLPRSGIKLMSPALASRSVSSVLGKSVLWHIFINKKFMDMNQHRTCYRENPNQGLWNLRIRGINYPWEALHWGR